MTTIDLAKDKIIDHSEIAKKIILNKELTGVHAQVKVAYSISGSMSERYRSGLMQGISDKLLALAMNIDPDQSIDIFTYNDQAYDMGTVTLNNFYGFVDRNITSRVGGGASYAPVMKEILQSCGININSAVRQTEPPPIAKRGILSRLFGPKDDPQEQQAAPSTKKPVIHPIYAIIITDGEHNDQAETGAVLRASSHYGVHWKFVGIGSDEFSFLEEIDEMEGRLIENTSFITIPKIDRIPVDRLYAKLLGGFTEWLQEACNYELVTSAQTKRIMGVTLE